MSITITGQFDHPYEAQQAALRLRRRGYTVSQPSGKPRESEPQKVLVADPFGNLGGYTFGNNLMGGLPPLAGQGVVIRKDPPTMLSVLTDDTSAADARRLLEALGAKIV